MIVESACVLEIHEQPISKSRCRLAERNKNETVSAGVFLARAPAFELGYMLTLYVGGQLNWLVNENRVTEDTMSGFRNLPRMEENSLVDTALRCLKIQQESSTLQLEVTSETSNISIRFPGRCFDLVAAFLSMFCGFASLVAFVRNLVRNLVRKGQNQNRLYCPVLCLAAKRSMFKKGSGCRYPMGRPLSINAPTRQTGQMQFLRRSQAQELFGMRLERSCSGQLAGYHGRGPAGSSLFARLDQILATQLRYCEAEERGAVEAGTVHCEA